MNGFTIEADPVETYVFMVDAIAEGRFRFSVIAKVLRAVPQVSIEVARAGVLRDRHMDGVDLTVEVFRSLCGLLPWRHVEGEIVAAGKNLPPST